MHSECCNLGLVPICAQCISLRTSPCLQVRELEEEIEALAVGREHRRALKELMNKKELVGDLFNNLRLTRQRLNNSARANSSTINTSSNGSSSSQGSSSTAGGVSEEVWSLPVPSCAQQPPAPRYSLGSASIHSSLLSNTCAQGPSDCLFLVAEGYVPGCTRSLSAALHRSQPPAVS